MISLVCRWDRRTRTGVNIRPDALVVRGPTRIYPFRFLALDYVRVEHHDGASQTTQATLQAGNVYQAVPNRSEERRVGK